MGVFAKVVQELASAPIEARRAKHEKKVLDQYGESMDEREFNALLRISEPVDRERGEVRKHTFVLGMLMKLDKVSHDDISACVERYNLLDHDGSGCLTLEDMDRG